MRYRIQVVELEAVASALRFAMQLQKLAEEKLSQTGYHI